MRSRLPEMPQTEHPRRPPAGAVGRILGLWRMTGQRHGLFPSCHALFPSPQVMFLWVVAILLDLVYKSEMPTAKSK